MKMESGWNSYQTAPAPHRANIPHSRRRGEQILCRFEGRRLGCCVGENGSRLLCAGPDSLSLLEVMARSAVAHRAFGVAARGGPMGCGDPAISASHVDDDLVPPGKSQITDNERALVSCT